jgi:serine/threonine protein kinase
MTMGFTPGTRVGSYEITAAIGAGGMGEVYRARDTDLKREVAIKVLPAALSDDADRLARRLATPTSFNPHWLARDQLSNPLVLGAGLGGESGYFVLHFNERADAFRSILRSECASSSGG